MKKLNVTQKKKKKKKKRRKKGKKKKKKEFKKIITKLMTKKKKYSFSILSSTWMNKTIIEDQSPNTKCRGRAKKKIKNELKKKRKRY
jgi:hypothetical protein